MQRAVQLQFAR